MYGANIEQRLWLNEGDEALRRPYEGKMESDQLDDTLEHLYPAIESHT